MGGAKTVNPNLTAPDPSGMYAGLIGQAKAGQLGLERQAQLLQAYASTPPPMQTFDTARVSKEAAELGMANIQNSREFERLVNPEFAKMRGELGSHVAQATNLDASKQWADNWALKKGLMSGVGADSLIGRSAIFDASTAAGRQARLQNLGLQQGYLAQTPAPIGGLDPASAIQAEMAARAQNLQAMQQWQGNIMRGAQGYNQSTSDWINQNMGGLIQANQVADQNRRNYEMAMYKAAQQNAAARSGMMGSMFGAGGAIAGAAIGTMIAPGIGTAVGAGIGGSLGSAAGGMA